VKSVPKNKPIEEIAEEVNLLSTMLESLVELLEEKGVVSQSEWEKRIKERTVIK
jgi:predicted transcriptional regulator